MSKTRHHRDRRPAPSAFLEDLAECMRRAALATDQRELVDGTFEAIDVPDGDYSTRAANLLAVQDSQERHHRRAQRRKNRFPSTFAVVASSPRYMLRFKHHFCTACLTAIAFGVSPPTQIECMDDGLVIRCKH